VVISVILAWLEVVPDELRARCPKLRIIVTSDGQFRLNFVI